VASLFWAKAQPNIACVLFLLAVIIAQGPEGGDSTFFQPMQAQGMLHRELVVVNPLRVIAMSQTWLIRRIRLVFGEHRL